MPKVMSEAASRRVQGQAYNSDSEAKVSIPENSVKTPKVKDPKVSIPKTPKTVKGSAASAIFTTRNAYAARKSKKLFAEAAKRRSLRNGRG